MFELANAVNKIAYWLEQNFGASTVFETLAYMGPSDLRYAIVFLAAVCEISHFAEKKDDSLRLGPQVRIVGLSELVEMLDQVDQSDTRELTAKPAVKVLNFFRALEKAKAEGKTEFKTGTWRC
ncbi:hypothetical protein MMC18_008196 [Xylographa bjoerkii]|nr:hypothetical protein [Xylographa bjoerkii]